MQSARVRVILVALATLWLSARGTSASVPRSLTLDERIAAQRAIEEVYWRHRIWPKDNRAPKPSLDAVMPERAIRAKVEDYLKKSNALEVSWRRPITGDQLQAELDRMARGSRDSHVLQELFDALGNDAGVIAETLVRPALAERLIRNWHQGEVGATPSTPSFDTWWQTERTVQSIAIKPLEYDYRLPALDPKGCTIDSWSPTLTEVPDARHRNTAVWTGTEMIVWGGYGTELPTEVPLATGGRYNPALDTWAPTSTAAGCPTARIEHTAVWTGTEMIVWGGGLESTGGRYNPVTDTWVPTSTAAGAPAGRYSHTAIWTGTEMIVWGGWTSGGATNSGGRYTPSTDSWTPTSTGSNVPSPRSYHTAVWTGNEMIVWGGIPNGVAANSGARYLPSTDSWAPTSTSTNVPSGREEHTAIWSGSEMIVWGGSGDTGTLKTGGRYNPSTDSWSPTSTGPNVPSARQDHVAVWTGSKMIIWASASDGSGGEYDPSTDSWTPTPATSLPPTSFPTAVWTGTEMIVWGGIRSPKDVNTGSRYNPTTGSWVATSVGAAVPAAREAHTAVWTGAEMIVWGGTTGLYAPISLNTGGRYSPATDTWIPTSLGPGAPTPRDGHTAVWTGREMVVWGGEFDPIPPEQSQLLNTGARYNPMSDTWTATSTGAGVPLTRTNHQAIWTGKEMIIWSGIGSYGDPGRRYDPTADAWLPMASGADGFLMWTGTEALTWGAGAGARYNPMTNLWTAIPPSPGMLSPRNGHSWVWTGSEMIIWGGGDATSQYLNTGARYNPITNVWVPTSTGLNAPDPRSFHNAVWTGAEMIVWGGIGSPPAPSAGRGGGRYDPVTDSWLPISLDPHVPGKRFYATSVWTGQEMIIWGGRPVTATGGRYCACPSGRIVYRDGDGDGYGDPGISAPTCDGSAPAGYVVDGTDCNDASSTAHPGAPEVCDGLDNDCNGLVDESVSGDDTDADTIHDLCDNCPFAFNSAQSDFDHDNQGDACDLNDGLIYEWRNDKTSVSWQAEQGPTSWNVYIGDLDVLKATGVYTQLPGSNALAGRHCGEIATVVSESSVPAAGRVSFSLITGVAGGIEGSLGASSAGPRANTNPCP